MPSLLQLRRTCNGVINDGYLFFCHKFVKCVVGLQAYNHGVKNGVKFSEIASPSDEGMALILLENSYKQWNAEYDDMVAKGNDDNQEETAVNVQGAQYTTAGKNKAKKGFTKKYCGWKQSGIEKFNELVCQIRADRKMNGEEFDNHLSRISSSKTSEGDEEEMEEVPVATVVRAENDLEFPESNSEGDSDDDSDDDSN